MSNKEIRILLKVVDGYLNCLIMCFPLGMGTKGNYTSGKDSTYLKCSSVPKNKSESVTGK